MRSTRILMTIAAAVLITLASACNTLRGVGKDIQRTGEKIQEWTR